MSEVSVGIDALKFHPDPPGHTMLHAFNTTYADITLHADKLKEAGISHVLTSPPLTWRADGPSTPSDKKGMWYHAYQPEDLRFIENPHGNLQSYFEMITVLKARGIDVIADIPLNFMGIGGEGGAGGDDHRGTLLYPSKDIREERTASIRRGSGRVEGQTLVHTLKGTIPGTTTQGPIQQYPDMPFTSLHDFEPSRSDVSDWDTPKNIRHNRLDGMPKVSAKSMWILNAQRDYLQSLKGLGVKGFRIDAEKHMTSKQLAHVLPHDITKDMLVFGETITPGGEDPAWRDYLRLRLQMRCSGQLKLATVLEFFQYRFSDSFGDNP
ncbi:alpha-amylase family glycosyl hydrolase, partial [Escherichia fergusonii]